MSTLLHDAVDEGNIECIRSLILKGCNVNEISQDGNTPLHIASQNGNKDVLMMLIEVGADVNTSNRVGHTPLHMAANRDIVRILIDFGAKTDSRNKAGLTPLHLAACRDVVEALIAGGADVNPVDSEGCTPLHIAAKSGMTEIVSALLDNGANPSMKDNDGYSPQHVDIKNNRKEIISIFYADRKRKMPRSNSSSVFSKIIDAATKIQLFLEFNDLCMERENRGGCFYVMWPKGIYLFPALSIGLLLHGWLKVYSLILFVSCAVAIADRHSFFRRFSRVRMIGAMILALSLLWNGVLWVAVAVFVVGGAIGIVNSKRWDAVLGAASMVVWGVLSVAGYYAALGMWIPLGMMFLEHHGACEAPVDAFRNGKVYINRFEAYDVVSDGQRIITNGAGGINMSLKKGNKPSWHLEGASERVYYDDEKHVLYVPEYWDKNFLVYDMETGKLLAKLRTSHRSMLDVERCGKYICFLAEDYGGTLYLLDDEKILKAEHFPIIARSPDDPRFLRKVVLPMDSPYSIRYNRLTGKVYITSWTAGTILKYDMATLRLERKRSFLVALFGLTLDEDGDRVFAAQPGTSRIIEMDGRTLRVLEYLPAGYGVRDIQFDRRRNAIYSANYLDGTFTQTSVSKRRITRRINCGPATRGVYHSELTDDVYVVSACGCVRIRPVR